MKHQILAAALLVAGAANAQQVMDGSTSEIGETEYKKIVAALLLVANDPFSAQFAGLKRATGKPDLVCGLINLKNGYGAYSGFKMFAYDDEFQKLFMEQNVSDCLR